MPAETAPSAFGASSAFAAQDLNTVKTTLDGISLSGDKVAASLSRAFAGAVVSGKSFDDTLKTVAASLAKVLLQSGAQPLAQGLTGLFTGALSSAAATPVTPFAEGGIVSQPTYFGSGGGAGLMGERGAEAILPLSRGPDGRLGIAGGSGGAPVNINVRIATPDAESFRRSESQVTGALARAVARGQRGL